MRNVIQKTAAITTIAALTSCQFNHDKFSGFGETVVIKVSSASVRSDRLNTSLDLTNVKVEPRNGKKPCDIRVWVQADENGDGKISEDEKRSLYEKPGLFHGYTKKKVKLSLEGEVDSATLVVESRNADDKKAPPERQMFGIDREGVHRLSLERPVALFVAGGSYNDHFVEIISNGPRGVQLAVGDLRKRSGTAAKLARPGRADFLAAAVIVDQKLLTILVGNDITAASLPPLTGKVGDIRIVTFDRSLRRCADFEIENLRGS